MAADCRTPCAGCFSRNRHPRQALPNCASARAAGRRALPGNAFSKVTMRRLNGLDNPFRYPDHFDAMHIKSSETIRLYRSAESQIPDTRKMPGISVSVFIRSSRLYSALAKPRRKRFYRCGVYPALFRRFAAARNNRVGRCTSDKRCDTRHSRKILPSIRPRAGIRISRTRGSPPRSTYRRSGTACACSAP